jgi:hypothetical protein
MEYVVGTIMGMRENAAVLSVHHPLSASTFNFSFAALTLSCQYIDHLHIHETFTDGTVVKISPASHAGETLECFEKLGELKWRLLSERNYERGESKSPMQIATVKGRSTEDMIVKAQASSPQST